MTCFCNLFLLYLVSTYITKTCQILCVLKLGVLYLVGTYFFSVPDRSWYYKEESVYDDC